MRSLCEDLAILNGGGKPAIHAHRFRPTLGTQLGRERRPHPDHHENPRAQERWHVDDLREHLRPVVLADYQSALPPGAVIAGPLADTRGWEREVDRHQRVAERIRSLLSDLGEPSAPPNDPS